MDRRDEVLEFIKTKSLMTIASINSSGKPEAALVGFGITNDFKLIFGTSNTSRKYQNLPANSSVAVAIGWDDTRTVQYQGEARELSSDDDNALIELYLAQHPESAKYRTLPDQRYFVVTPKWVRYTNLAAKPWDIVELSFG